MRLFRVSTLAALLVLVVWQVAAERAGAFARGRQYYGGWNYHSGNSYYYRNYYYKPYPTYDGYAYHYCIYYPTTPRYVYYYNPRTEVYWGRLDLEAEGENRYSLLEAKDRKKELKDIPEAAFPRPGKMPFIPESKDEIAIEAPPDDLPKK